MIEPAYPRRENRRDDSTHALPRRRSPPAASEEQAQRDSAQRISDRWAKRGFRVRRTPVGKGLFATKRIVDGSCIGEIDGRVIRDDDYVSRYAFDLDDGSQLEPDYPFRLVNHSCDPNCAFQNFEFSQPSSRTEPWQSLKPVRRLLLFAICDIAIGQELTIDYNWPACFAIRCQCRSPACRGWIVDPADLPRLQDALHAPPGSLP